jgi:hypothetical protein
MLQVVSVKFEVEAMVAMCSSRNVGSGGVFILDI